MVIPWVVYTSNLAWFLVTGMVFYVPTAVGQDTLMTVAAVTLLIILVAHLVHLSMSTFVSYKFLSLHFKFFVQMLSILGLGETIVLAVRWRSLSTPQRQNVAVR
ncbi:hypothetical protein C8R45DRAFT_1106022 [Mycena sanguinolenta]|nr:hypothetical protein C8R45DRAFT_1106022 [Mycena sanguinolenta]